jgi:hypothetical protein
MARNASKAVLQHADAQLDDPLSAYINQDAALGMDAARLAACMALVSIAEDLHRIAEQWPPR